MVVDFEARFPFGAPSLVACESLSIEGDFKFGRNVTCRGTVDLVNESGSQVASGIYWIRSESATQPVVVVR